jgi:threonyl-tRNA synthetase
MAESSEEARHLEFAGEFDCLPEPLPTLRHSTSHVMAQAVKRLFPEVKVASVPPSRTGSA